MKTKTERSAYSLLAGFDSILSEYYGIYGIDGSNLDILLSDAQKYLSSSESLSGLIFDARNEWKESGYLETDFTDKVNLEELRVEPDGNLGSIDCLKNSIIGTMKYRTPANMLTDILEKLDILSGTDNMSEAYKMYMEAADVISSAKEHIDQLNLYVEGLYINQADCINGFFVNSIRPTNYSLLETANEIVQGIQILDDFQSSQNEYDNNIEMMKFIFNGVGDEFKLYLELNQNALIKLDVLNTIKSNMQVIINKLEIWIRDYTPETEMENYYKEQTEEKYKQLCNMNKEIANQQLRSPINANILSLDKAVNACNEAVNILNSADINNNKIDCNVMEKHIKDMSITKMNVGLSVNVISREANNDSAQFDPRSNATNVSINELSEYNLSEIEQSLYNSLPSVMYDNSSVEQLGLDFDLDNISSVTNLFSGNLNFVDLVKEEGQVLCDNVMINDYILTYFGNVLDNKTNRSHVLFGETEYIIAGNREDSENLFAVFSMIFGIRFVLNVIHILCDADKYNLSKSIGSSLAGLITGGVLAPVFTVLVIAAWAITESALDINDLKNGKSVPLIKNKNQWKSGIAGLSNNNSQNSQNESSKLLEMEYVDYLRIILMFTPSETKLLRINDLIDVNVSNMCGGRFYLSNFYTKVNVFCVYSVTLSGCSLNFIPYEKRNGNKYIMEANGIANYE